MESWGGAWQKQQKNTGLLERKGCPWLCNCSPWLPTSMPYLLFWKEGSSGRTRSQHRVLRRSSRQLQKKGLQRLSRCSVTGMGNKHGKENGHLTLSQVKLWSSWTFLPQLLHKAGPAAANCQGLNHAYRACSRSQWTILLAPSATIQRLLTQNEYSAQAKQD